MEKVYKKLFFTEKNLIYFFPFMTVFLAILFLPQVHFDPLYMSNQVLGWMFAKNHTKSLILNHPHMLDVVNTKT